MLDPLLQGYDQGHLDVDKELLMSFFYKDNREKEGTEMPMSLRKMNVQELMKRLNTSRHGGITEDKKELNKRREKYGANVLISDYSHQDFNDNDYVDVNLSHEKSICTYIFEFFSDKIWRFLLVSCIILLIICILEDVNGSKTNGFHDWVVGVTVLLMIVFIMLINIFIERYKHNGLLYMLRSMEAKIEATVIRDGKEFLIKQSELLVGDIVILSGGDSIPADCLVIEANLQAEVDESYLTPDINPVQKKSVKTFDETIDKLKEDSKGSDDGNSIETPDPFLLGSTLVVSGRMKALVLAVGNNTYARSQNLHSPYYTMMGEKRTILHSKIDRIVSIVGKYAFILCILIFI
jgi:Ca2+-transporting ATPase